MRNALVVYAIGLLCSFIFTARAQVLQGFPENFTWGTAIAAYQVEGGNLYSDWYQWEQMGKIGGKQSGLSANHYLYYQEDFSKAKSLGTSAIRLSLEWARIEPMEDRWDMEAVAHYRAVLLDLKAKGLKPHVTLLHYTLPHWLVDFKNPEKSHFLTTRAVDEFVEFAAFVATTFGDLIDDYATMNEPNMMALNGVLLGSWPPGLSISPGEIVGILSRTIVQESYRHMTSRSTTVRRIALMVYNLLLAHIAAYDTVKRCDTSDADGDGQSARVGIVYNFAPLAKDVQGPPFFISLYKSLSDDFLRTLHTGKVTLFGNAGLSQAQRALPAERIVGRVDVLGVNYYTAFNNKDLWDFLGFQISRQFGLKPREPASDFAGFAVRPRALTPLLKDLHKRYGWELIVSENGIATNDEALRHRYLVEHVAAVREALADGIPVRGYFVWSLIDTMEWNEGFDCHFGLFGVDRQTFARTTRPAACTYRDLIAGRPVSPVLDQSRVCDID